MIYDISPVNRYNGNNSSTQFDFDFYIENQSQLNVFHYDSSGNKTKLTYNIDYSINEINNKNGSYIIFPITGSEYGILSSDEKISLELTLPISQETEYNNSSLLNLESLEYSFDYLTRICQIQDRQLSRAIKVSEGSDITTDVLASNLNKVADINNDISTVAAISGDVTAVKNNSTNIATVSNSITNVNTVSESIANVNTVAADLENIDTVATNISDVNTVSDIACDVSTVAGISSDISAVKNNASDISSVADDLTSITAVASDLENIDAASSNAALAKQYAVGLPTEPSEGSAKYWAGQAAAGQVQSDWGESDTTSKAYILNKPDLTTKQDTLVSGTNIKTINSNSILGSGDLILDGLPSQTGNAGKFLTTDGSSASWANVESGSSRNIGEIVSSTIPLTDAGLHLLDGTLISGSGSYSDFVDYIADLYDSGSYSAIFETEANWQSAVTTYGVCGKFVYDSVNNTVRLPKISGIIEGTTSLSALGDLVQAGLPNITGSAHYVFSGDEVCSGALDTSQASSYGTSTSASGATKARTLALDASDSNSIYGNSTTVQPQTIKVLYYIVIATTTKTNIQVDIDEIATDLNGKADTDLSNINSSCKVLDGQWIPKYLEISTATSATSRTHDLSSYLPNDGYNYEVFIRMYAEYGSSAGTLAVGTVASPYDNRHNNTNAFIALAIATTGGRSSSVSTIIPISGRTLYSQISYALGSAQITAYGYRRIGTNT